MSNELNEQRLDELLAQGSWLRILALRLCEDETEADDVVQDVCLGALRSPPTTSADIRGWASAVAYRVRAFRRRNEANRRRRERIVAVHDSTRSGQAAADHELRRLRLRVVEAVLALSEPYRATVIARFFEDLTPTQIARRDGISAATVRSRLLRALTQLRDALRAEADGGDLRACLAPLLPLARRLRLWRLLGLAIPVAAVVSAALLWKGPEGGEPLDRNQSVSPSPTLARRVEAETAADPSKTSTPAPLPAPAADSPYRILPTLHLVDADTGRVRRDPIDLRVATVETDPGWQLLVVDAQAEGRLVDEVRATGGDRLEIPVAMPGLYRLAATADGVHGVTTASVQTESDLDWTMQVAPRLSVTMSDPSEVLESVEIAGTGEGWRALTRQEDGAWVLDEPLWVGTAVRVEVRSSPLRWSTPAGWPMAPLHIPEHRRQRILVADAETGNAVAGAAVAVAITTPQHRIWRCQTRTDGAGETEIPRWSLSYYRSPTTLAIKAAGYGTTRFERYSNLLEQVRPDAGGRIRIELHRCAALGGVLLHDDGSPAADHSLIMSVDGAPRRRGRTDRDGRFSLEPLDIVPRRPHGEVDALRGDEPARSGTAHLLCYGPAGSCGQLADVPYAALAERTWRGVLRPLGVGKALVFDDFGDPLGGVRLGLAAMSGKRLLGRLFPVVELHADDVGEVELPVIYGEGWRLMSFAEGYRPGHADLTAGEETARIEMIESERERYPNAVLRLRLVDAEGRGLAGTSATVMQSQTSRQRTAAADRDGCITVPGLAPSSSYWVFPKCPGYALSLGAARAFRPADELRTLLMVRCRPVRFTAADGSAPPGFGVMVSCTEGGPTVAIDLWDRWTRDLHLNEEELLLAFHAPGFRVARVAWRGSEDELAVRFVPGPRLTATVAAAASGRFTIEPLNLTPRSADVAESLRRYHDRFEVAGTWRDGRIDVGPLSPGRYRMTLFAGDAKLLTREIELEDSVDLGELRAP